MPVSSTNKKTYIKSRRKGIQEANMQSHLTVGKTTNTNSKYDVG